MKWLAPGAVMAALVLAGCGGGSSTTSMTPQEMCEADGGSYADGKCMSAMELAVAAEAKAIADAIAAARAAADALTAASSPEDVAAAQALVTAARELVKSAEHATPAATTASNDAIDGIGETVMMAKTDVDERIADETAMADRAADQKAALMRAAAAVDTSSLATQAEIDSAEEAIAALESAVAAAADVSDADKAMYQGQVTAAKASVMTAQSALYHAAQSMALREAVAALQALDLSGLSTQEKIDSAKEAIAALRMALNDASELSDAEKAEAMTELAAANRIVMNAQGSVDMADQEMVLEDAAAALEMIDLDDLMTQEAIDAANSAIVALDLALEGATDLTDAEKRDALVDVTVAKRKVMAAEEVLATNIGNQRMALTDAVAALGMIDLDDLSDQAKIDAADAAVMALKAALDGATHLSDAAKAMYQSQYEMATETVRTAQTGMDRDGRMAAQRMAVTDAVTAATTAVGAVNDDATDEQVTAADDAIASLKAAIDAAEDLAEGDTDVANAQGALDSLMPVLEAAKTSRTAAMEAAEEERRMAEAEAERKRNEANAATAAKLFAGIAAASGDTTTDGEGVRAATIVVDDDGGDPAISVNYGGATAAESTATLSVDKDTTVASNHGWGGKRYVEEDDDGNIITEARVYSDESPTMGAKFNGGETGDGAVGFGLNDAGALVLTTDLNTASRIASSRFTHTAGTHTFELPEDNPGGLTMLNFAGSYYGVAGTYTCTPGDGASACGVTRAANGGYTFVTPGSWTFKPTDPNARVTEMADTLYAVYGWWLRKPADGGTWVASAFDSYHAGTAPTFTGLDALNGSATYRGGAAGKYALSSSTGGTNDAGHFTARATLEADFDTDTITGTIDQFMSDGAAKDWSVALNKSGVSDAGAIAGDGTDGNTDMQKTVWTIGDDAAGASGQWRGQFQEVDTDSNVPKVVTGDFFTEFGTSGKMVGGFGAKTE